VSFTISLGQPVTVGGVTRCAFTVEMPKIELRSNMSVELDKQNVVVVTAKENPPKRSA